jgi:HK97 family phage prohead protease
MPLPAIDKHARRELYFGNVKLVSKVESGDKGPGELEGYLAVWNNVDSQHEIIEPGAFARSIKTAIPARKVKLMTRHFAHGGDVLDLIGTIVEAKEDDYGLFIRAEYSQIARAQEVRMLVNEKHVDGLSVGFYPVAWKFEEREAGAAPILRHTECALAEGTVTVRPANILAGITSSKNHEHRHAPQGTATPAPDGTAKASALTAKTASVLTAEQMKAGIERARAELFLLENL